MSEGQTVDSQSFITRMRCFFIIWLLVILVFSQTLSADYVDFDEPRVILNNALIRSPLSLANLKLIFTTFPANLYTPLSKAAFWLEYNLFGFQSGISHLISLILHLLAATLCFLFLEELLGCRRSALFASLFWALHPFQVESVAWVLERSNLMYGLFGFASLWLYMRFQKNGAVGSMILACFFMLLSGLSRPLAFIIPAVWLLIDWVQCRPVNLKLFKPKLAAFLISGLLIFLLFAGAWNWMPHKNGRELAWGRAFYAVSFYVAKTMVPTGLSPTLEENSSNPDLFEGSVFYLIFLAIVFALISKVLKQPRLFLLGIAFYFINILPVSGLVRVGHEFYAGVHLMYVPLLGLLIAFSAIVRDLAHRSDSLKLALQIFLMVVLVFFSGISYQHTKIWQNTESLFRYCLKLDPNGLFSRNQLAMTRLNKGFLAEAEIHFKQVLHFKPDYQQSLNGLAYVFLKTERFVEAIGLYDQLLVMRPDRSDLFFNRSLAKLSINDLHGAEVDLSSSLNIARENISAINQRLHVRIALGRYSAAIDDLDHLLRSSSANFWVYWQKFLILIESADLPKAMICLFDMAERYGNSENLKFLFQSLVKNLSWDTGTWLILPYRSLIMFWINRF